MWVSVSEYKIMEHDINLSYISNSGLPLFILTIPHFFNSQFTIMSIIFHLGIDESVLKMKYTTRGNNNKFEMYFSSLLFFIEINITKNLFFCFRLFLCF